MSRRSARRGAAISMDIEELRRDPAFIAAQLLLFLKITLLVLLIDPQAFDAFALPKSAASHALSAALAGLIALLALRWGRGIFVWSGVHVAVAALVVTFALATLLALDPYVAISGAWRRYLGLGHVLDSAVLYASATVLFPTERDRLRLLAAVLAASTVAVAYALVQAAGLDPVKYEIPTTRPIATFGNPDLSGGYFSVVAVTAVAVAILLWDRLAPVWRLTISLLAVAALGALFATTTRNGVVGVAGGLVAIAALIAARPAGLWRRGAAVALVLALFAALVPVTPLGARLDVSKWDVDPGVQSRLEIWETSRQLIAARPLLGLGPDNFAAAYPAARQERSVRINGLAVLQTSAHSWFLYAWTSAGAVGLTAMLTLAGLTVTAAIRLARRREVAALALVPLAAYLGQGLVDINDVSIDWILWLGAGIIAGAAGQRVAARPSVVTLYNLGTQAVLLLVLVLGTGWLAVRGWERVVASEAMLSSERLVAMGLAQEAWPHAQRAVRLVPERAEYWSAYGVALDRGGRVVASSQAFLGAAQRAPWQPLFWRNVAITRFGAGDNSGGISALDRAISADAYDFEALDLRARVALSRGEHELAARYADRAIRLFRFEPHFVETWDVALLANLQLLRFEEAERIATAALALHDSPRVRLRLAQTYAGTGRIELAVRELDRLIAADPTNREVRELRDRLAGR